MSARADRMLIAADEALRPITVRPVNVMDEEVFPEMALARKRLASLTPERRAELERDWL